MKTPEEIIEKYDWYLSTTDAVKAMKEFAIQEVREAAKTVIDSDWMKENI